MLPGRYARITPDRIRITERVGRCTVCKGRGEVNVHDPSADGHGGLNGGRWTYLECSRCGGDGAARSALVDYVRAT